MTDTWEPRPVPEVNPETEAFWRAASDGEFLLSACDDCGLVFHYPRSLCPDCFSEDVDWQQAAGTGTIYSYSVSESVSGWPEDGLPLVIAYVELDEGPRVMTNVQDVDPDDVEVGLAVEARFVPTEEENVAVPVFVPAE
ncbi:Zn-ribbon domain-containing OB-fold protein [Haloplanus sp. GCM10025708]|uniref:Zn-ribbon domain-containing OB-fold protein n=1 Tax=Haloferacaceae TaxID=1644056 RepID=UPI00362395D6